MVTIRLFFLVISFAVALILFSCNKEQNPLTSYQVSIKNNYSGLIDSIYVGDHFIDSLNINQETQPITLKKQEYQFSCKTFSTLKLTATINIQGLKENLTIIVQSDGKITIE